MNRTSDKLRARHHLANRVVAPSLDGPVPTNFSGVRPPRGYGNCVILDAPARRAIVVGKYLPAELGGYGERIEFEEAGLYAYAITAVGTDGQVKAMTSNARIEVTCLAHVGQGGFEVPERLKRFYGAEAKPHAFEVISRSEPHRQKDEIVADIGKKVRSYTQRH